MAAKQGVGAAIAVETGRVQGLESSIHDLTLRDGRGVTTLIGGNVVGTPQLTRSIEGSSSIELQIYDPELRWLEQSLASQKWDCEIDGLWFRYIGTTKSGAMMTLKFEDREVALLRELFGPVTRYAHRGQPNELTLAEFICGLVEQIHPTVPIVCPQLEEQRPIKTDRQAKKAAKEAPAKRAPGIGDTKGLKVKGQAPIAHQTELLNMALNIANSRPCPLVCKVAVVAALIDETDAGEAGGGNVLQALGSGGAKIRPASEEISGFLFGDPEWTGVSAVGYHNANPQAGPAEIATNVQRNRDGASSYEPFVAEARAWVEAHGGGTEGELEAGATEQKLPRAFEVKAKGGKNGGPEDYWEAIQRYAKAVNWRAFFCAGVFYYISEDELARGAVRLAIRREPGQRKPVNQAVEDVDFDANANKSLNECTVTAFAEGWGVPPGAVSTVAGYGPASLGPGDAPPKEKQKEAIASAVKASTHEGKGRYLVAKITLPLVGDPAARKATISLRKPTRPLPEAASETASASASAGTGAGSMPPGIAAAIEEADHIDAQKYPYESPGARGTPPPARGPYDCSGVTCRILYVACGEPGTTLASEELSKFGEPGEGEWLTIYAHGPNGPTGHALSHIKKADGTWWFFGTSESNPGGGAGWIPESEYDAGYLAQFSKRHPKGL
jgi:hypothetical protein